MRHAPCGYIAPQSAAAAVDKPDRPRRGSAALSKLNRPPWRTLALLCKVSCHAERVTEGLPHPAVCSHPQYGPLTDIDMRLI